eukprot:62355-Prymnesium_polylepis.1
MSDARDTVEVRAPHSPSLGTWHFLHSTCTQLALNLHTLQLHRNATARLHSQPTKRAHPSPGPGRTRTHTPPRSPRLLAGAPLTAALPLMSH